MSICNINYTTKIVTQDFVGTVTMVTWNPLLWTIDYNETIYGKILYTISGLIPNSTYHLIKYNYDGTINQTFDITTDSNGSYSISSGTPKILIEGNFPVQPTSTCNINYTTKTVTQNFVGTIKILTWSPLSWTIDFDESITGKILYNISGLVLNTTYLLTKYNYDGTINQSFNITTDATGKYSITSGSPKILIEGTFPCVPSWACETPLNGYEKDGCGNRRLNSNCNPCVPSWACETPLNGYEKDGCGNRKPNINCNSCSPTMCNFTINQ